MKMQCFQYLFNNCGLKFILTLLTHELKAVYDTYNVNNLNPPLVTRF